MCVLEFYPRKGFIMNTIKLRQVLCALLGTVICTTAAFSFSGCENEKQDKNQSTGDTAPYDVATADTATSTDDEANDLTVLESLGIDAASLGIEPNINQNDDIAVGYQIDNPNEGDTIAVLKTSMGDITIRFFPELAPKTVTNFINLAKQGSYDNTTFYRVIDDFIIQGGNPEQTSSYGADFEDEFSDKLFNIRGAVSMANSNRDTNTSQFFINQKDAETFKAEGGWTALEENWKSAKTQLINYKDSNLLSTFIDQYGATCYDTDLVPDSVKALYDKNGGNAHLDGAYNAVDRGNTVFAQVIKGMDVVDKIASVKTDENDIPTEDVVIEKIEIKTYSNSTDEISENE